MNKNTTNHSNRLCVKNTLGLNVTFPKNRDFATILRAVLCTVLVAAVLVAGCRPLGGKDAVVTSTPIPTPIATPVVTGAPTAVSEKPTATPALTAEPTATPTPTAEPTATVEPFATPVDTAILKNLFYEWYMSTFPTLLRGKMTEEEIYEIGAYIEEIGITFRTMRMRHEADGRVVCFSKIAETYDDYQDVFVFEDGDFYYDFFKPGSALTDQIKVPEKWGELKFLNAFWNDDWVIAYRNGVLLSDDEEDYPQAYMSILKTEDDWETWESIDCTAINELPSTHLLAGSISESGVITIGAEYFIRSKYYSPADGWGYGERSCYWTLRNLEQEQLLYRSVDNGKTWENIYDELINMLPENYRWERSISTNGYIIAPEKYVMGIYFEGDYGVLMMSPAFVFRTRNGGRNWSYDEKLTEALFERAEERLGWKYSWRE